MGSDAGLGLEPPTPFPFFFCRADLPPLPKASDGAAVVAVGDSVYVIGGSTNNSHLIMTADKVVLMFSLRTRAWSRMPSLPTPRCAATAQV